MTTSFRTAVVTQADCSSHSPSIRRWSIANAVFDRTPSTRWLSSGTLWSSYSAGLSNHCACGLVGPHGGCWRAYWRFITGSLDSSSGCWPVSRRRFHFGHARRDWLAAHCGCWLFMHSATQNAAAELGFVEYEKYGGCWPIRPQPLLSSRGPSAGFRLRRQSRTGWGCSWRPAGLPWSTSARTTTSVWPPTNRHRRSGAGHSAGGGRRHRVR